MPNLKSAKKRLRQAEVRTLVNSSRKSRVRTAYRKFTDTLKTGDLTSSKAAYSGFCSALDKAAKAGVLKKNNAVRRKARAASKIRALEVQA